MAEYRGKKKKEEGFSEAAVVEAVIQGILNLLKMLITGIIGMLRGGKPSSEAQAAARVQIQEGWEQVEMHLMQEATLSLAVSEADKLLDAAMQYSRIPGSTMGERLKAARDRFPADLYQQVWDAHKVRNTLAHEIGASVNKATASQAVSAFRAALYHLQLL